MSQLKPPLDGASLSPPEPKAHEGACQKRNPEKTDEGRPQRSRQKMGVDFEKEGPQGPAPFPFGQDGGSAWIQGDEERLEVRVGFKARPFSNGCQHVPRYPRQEKGPGAGLFGIALEQGRVMHFEGKGMIALLRVKARVQQLIQSFAIDPQGTRQANHGQKSTADQSQYAMGLEPESTLTKEVLDGHRNECFLKGNPEGYPKSHSPGDSEGPGPNRWPAAGDFQQHR